MTIDYYAYPVLFVDDEQQNLVAFEYAMEEQFSVLTAQAEEVRALSTRVTVDAAEPIKAEVKRSHG
jgi:hypothetical protein